MTGFIIVFLRLLLHFDARSRSFSSAQTPNSPTFPNQIGAKEGGRLSLCFSVLRRLFIIGAVSGVQGNWIGCHTGNGIEGALGCTRLGSQLGPLFHICCDILSSYPDIIAFGATRLHTVKLKLVVLENLLDPPRTTPRLFSPRLPPTP